LRQLGRMESIWGFLENGRWIKKPQVSLRLIIMK